LSDQVKESKKKRIHAIKSQWRMKKKEEEQTAKQVCAEWPAILLYQQKR
jgi:hypothetical protein